VVGLARLAGRGRRAVSSPLGPVHRGQAERPVNRRTAAVEPCVGREADVVGLAVGAIVLSLRPAEADMTEPVLVGPCPVVVVTEEQIAFLGVLDAYSSRCSHTVSVSELTLTVS
jgi:hypothetical protein